MRLARIALPLALSALCIPCALADQAILQAAKDNTLFSHGDFSNGVGPYIFSGATANIPVWGYRRALIAFDITSMVPSGSTINSGLLSLNLSRGGSFSPDLNLHRLTNNWGEGTSNSFVNGGGGAEATEGDATWRHTFYSAATPQFWTNPGGDFVATSSATATVGAMIFEIGNDQRFAQDLQLWLDSPATNFGWILIGNEAGVGNAARFDSRENSEPSFRPTLTINFTPPQPQWDLNANGSWADSNNWNTGIVPDGLDAIANFLGVITAPRTVTLDGNKSVRALRFDNSQSYTIAPGTGGTLTVLGRINTDSSSHFITAKLILPGSTDLEVEPNATLTLSGGLEIGLNQQTIKGSSGRLIISGPQTHQSGASLRVSEGPVHLNSNAGAPGNSTTAASANLSIIVHAQEPTVVLGVSQNLANLDIVIGDPGPQGVDLASTPTEFHSISIHGGNLDSAKASLGAAINHAKANPGDGIFDSGLHANSGIGIAKLIDAHGDPFVFIRPTRVGDLNLDGSVTISDFIDLASHFNGTGSWQEGDLNGDGQITISDFIDLASNFNSSYSGEIFPVSALDQQMLKSFAAAHGVALVPEPGALSLILLSTLTLFPRRSARLYPSRMKLNCSACHRLPV